jgi:UDP-glucose 4-epimerase
VKAIGEGGDSVLNDDTNPSPEDAYGRSKRQAEKTMYEVADKTGIAAVALRFPLVYGPGVKGNVLRLFDAIWHGIPLPIGSIVNQRTMLGIDNLSGFLRAFLLEPNQTRRPILVSDRESISTRELAIMIGQALHKRPKLVNVPISLLRFMGRIGDLLKDSRVQFFSTTDVERLTGSLRIDPSRGWSVVGIEPPVSLRIGIQQVAEWYLNRPHNSQNMDRERFPKDAATPAHFV